MMCATASHHPVAAHQRRGELERIPASSRHPLSCSRRHQTQEVIAHFPSPRDYLAITRFSSPPTRSGWLLTRTGDRRRPHCRQVQVDGGTAPHPGHHLGRMGAPPGVRAGGHYDARRKRPTPPVPFRRTSSPNKQFARASFGGTPSARRSGALRPGTKAIDAQFGTRPRPKYRPGRWRKSFADQVATSAIVTFILGAGFLHLCWWWATPWQGAASAHHELGCSSRGFITRVLRWCSANRCCSPLPRFGRRSAGCWCPQGTSPAASCRSLLPARDLCWVWR